MLKRNKKDHQLNTFFIIHQIRANDRYIYIYKEEKEDHRGPTAPQPFSSKVKTSSPNCTHSLGTLSPDLNEKEKPHSPVITLSR